MLALSLRARIFAACVLAGSGTSILFGFLSLALLEAMEFEQVDLVLDDELKRFATAHANDRATVPPSTSFIKVWAVPLGDAASLPPELRGLGPGATELEGVSDRRAAVRDVGGWRYAAVLDLTLMEPWEDRVEGGVIALVALCIVLSCLLGRWLADRVVVPVTRLAEMVARSDPNRSGENFIQDVRQDEVGTLAAALEDYSQRIERFARREREFSAYMSHELRTPLAVMMSSVELARALIGKDPAILAPLDRAAGAGADLVQTLDALMVLGRVQSAIAAPEPVDVRATVEAVVEEMSLEDPRRRGLIAFCTVGTPAVEALPGALRIVVRNLLENACNHSGGEPVDVLLEADVLQVRDRGPGIREEDRARLFESFYQGHDASGGSGLGLAIAQRICAHEGWTLTLDPAPGGGTVARIGFGARLQARRGTTPLHAGTPSRAG